MTIESTSGVPLIFPRDPTPEVREVLKLMIWVSGTVALAFQDSGDADIKSRAEDEQAIIFHCLLTLALEHGADWRRRAGETLAEDIAEAKAVRAAREAARG